MTQLSSFQLFAKVVIGQKMPVVHKVVPCYGSMAVDSLKTVSIQFHQWSIQILFNWRIISVFITAKCILTRQPIHNWHATHRRYLKVSIKFEFMSMATWFHSINTLIQIEQFLSHQPVKHQQSRASHHNREHHNHWLLWPVHSEQHATHEMLKVVLKITILSFLGKMIPHVSSLWTTSVHSSIYLGGHLCNVVNQLTGTV